MIKKNIITDALKAQVKTLFDQGIGGRNIAKTLGISRQFVKKIYIALGLYNVQRRNIILRNDEGVACKKCRECGQVKPLEQFPWANKRTNLRDTRCRECTVQAHTAYYQDNKHEICEQKKQERRQSPTWQPTFEEVVDEALLHRVKALQERGGSISAIARELNISYRWSRSAFDKLGLEPISQDNIVTEDLKTQTTFLFDQGWGTRRIAKHLGITRDFVQKIYKALGIYNIGRKKPRKALPTEKQCITCSSVKPINQFRQRRGQFADGTERISYEAECQDCESPSRNTFRRKRYRQDHPEQPKLTEAEKLEERRAYYREYTMNRREEDPAFKLRTYISTAIWSALRQSASSKTGSILQYLPYTIPELLAHLESLFEPWMTWYNHGMYITEIWNDNDPSTWVWQLDHIIPQSDLPFKSMEEENFKKCWALANLRPLSGKLNHSDGVKRVRHKKVA